MLYDRQVSCAIAIDDFGKEDFAGTPDKILSCELAACSIESRLVLQPPALFNEAVTGGFFSKGVIVDIIVGSPIVLDSVRGIYVCVQR